MKTQASSLIRAVKAKNHKPRGLKTTTALCHSSGWWGRWRDWFLLWHVKKTVYLLTPLLSGCQLWGDHRSHAISLCLYPFSVSLFPLFLSSLLYSTLPLLLFFLWHQSWVNSTMTSLQLIIFTASLFQRSPCSEMLVSGNLTYAFNSIR